MILTIIIFLLVIGLLVFVHEFGHFLVAKKSGIKVEEFGFGFPPKIFGIKRGETLYSLNLIPLGGFVRLLGEERSIKNEKSFSEKSIIRRFSVLIAGVLANFLLGFILFAIVLSVGTQNNPILDLTLPKNNSKNEVAIAEVTANTPASSIGLQKGDILEKSDGTVFTNTQSLVDFTNNNQGKEIPLTFKRDDKEITKNVTLRIVKEGEEGALGASIFDQQIIKLPWYEAIPIAFLVSVKLIGLIFVGLYKVLQMAFTQFKFPQDVAGPVGIAAITGQAARSGITFFMQFLAFLSLNLFVINIIPFPALDGGRILFLGIEKIRGRKVSQNIENLVHTIGFMLLIILIIIISYHDIINWKKYL